MISTLQILTQDKDERQGVILVFLPLYPTNSHYCDPVRGVAL